MGVYGPRKTAAFGRLKEPAPGRAEGPPRRPLAAANAAALRGCPRPLKGGDTFKGRGAPLFLICKTLFRRNIE